MPKFKFLIMLFVFALVIPFCTSENKKENQGQATPTDNPETIRSEDKKEVTEFEKQIQDQELLFQQNREFEKYIDAKCIRSSTDCYQRCKNAGIYNFATLFGQIAGGKYLLNKSDHSTAYNSKSCQEFCESNNKEIWSLCDLPKK